MEAEDRGHGADASGEIAHFLNLSQAQDGFQIQTKDFAALIGINSQKGFDSTMTVRKGSAITTPKYKNLDEWSLDDLLVLLGSIGGLLGFK